MTDTDIIESEIYALISSLVENNTIVIGADSPLIGDKSLLDSMRLVELCLALEDKAGDLGFEFDWTSDAAMSRSRSMFRTAGALVQEFLGQRQASR